MSATAETDLHAELMREHADHREMTELAGRVLAENERLRAALVAAAHHQPAPLTDAQIDQITAEQWGRGLGAPYAAYRAYARAVLAAAGVPVAWIQPDHLQKAKRAPFLCRVEPTQRCADFVPLYAAPQPAPV